MRHISIFECGMSFFHNDGTMCASCCGVYQMMMYLSSIFSDRWKCNGLVINYGDLMIGI